jgi:hypothetical protein
MTQKSKRLAALAPQPGADTSTSKPALDRAIQARIGDNLRAMYDQLLQQPVPDRFRDLLGKLDDQGDRKGQSR